MLSPRGGSREIAEWTEQFSTQQSEQESCVIAMRSANTSLIRRERGGKEEMLPPVPWLLLVFVPLLQEGGKKLTFPLSERNNLIIHTNNLFALVCALLVSRGVPRCLLCVIAGEMHASRQLYTNNLQSTDGRYNECLSRKPNSEEN